LVIYKDTWSAEHKTLHVSDSSSVHHQEFHTVHKATVYVIQVLLTACKQYHPDPASKLSAKPVWHILLLCVQHETPDDGQRNCPKHVVLFQNKFEKLLHLVGFTTRIYHDAWSSECKIKILASAYKYWTHTHTDTELGRTLIKAAILSAETWTNSMLNMKQESNLSYRNICYVTHMCP